MKKIKKNSPKKRKKKNFIIFIHIDCNREIITIKYGIQHDWFFFVAALELDPKRLIMISEPRVYTLCRCYFIKWFWKRESCFAACFWISFSSVGLCAQRWLRSMRKNYKSTKELRLNWNKRLQLFDALSSLDLTCTKRKQQQQQQQ